jgi:hypothetical protein
MCGCTESALQHWEKPSHSTFRNPANHQHTLKLPEEGYGTRCRRAASECRKSWDGTSRVQAADRCVNANRRTFRYSMDNKQACIAVVRSWVRTLPQTKTRNPARAEELEGSTSGAECMENTDRRASLAGSHSIQTHIGAKQRHTLRGAFGAEGGVEYLQAWGGWNTETGVHRAGQGTRSRIASRLTHLGSRSGTHFVAVVQ